MTASCAKGWYWDSYVCNCIRYISPWYQIDYEKESALEIPETLDDPVTEAPLADTAAVAAAALAMDPTGGEVESAKPKTTTKAPPATSGPLAVPTYNGV